MPGHGGGSVHQHGASHRLAPCPRPLTPSAAALGGPALRKAQLVPEPMPVSCGTRLTVGSFSEQDVKGRGIMLAAAAWPGALRIQLTPMSYWKWNIRF